MKKFQAHIIINLNDLGTNAKSKSDKSTYAIGRVSCSADRFVVAESFVLRINIFTEKPAHRKSAKR